MKFCRHPHDVKVNQVLSNTVFLDILVVSWIKGTNDHIVSVGSIYINNIRKCFDYSLYSHFLKIAFKPTHVREIQYNKLLLKYLCTLLECTDQIDIMYMLKHAVKRDSCSLVCPHCIEII